MRSRSGKVRRLGVTPQELLQSRFLLDSSLIEKPLDFPAIFGNALPVELEIGSGKGSFLLRRASQRPEINLLGVEWVQKYALYGADRARRAGLGNVKLVCADAAGLFKTSLPDRSLWRVHIYFPDPWPKKKHHRRRLIQPEFLRHVRRVLKLGGWLGIVTDHADYFRQISSALSAVRGLVPVPFHSQTQDGQLVGTNFERKYSAGGKPFYRLAALRYR
jgi:tRNA (guanine-N7-)-methyltransferase